MNPNCLSTPAPLAVFPDRGVTDDDTLLACVCFDAGVPTGDRTISVPLPALAGNYHSEAWHGDSPASRGRAGAIGYAHNGQVCFGNAYYPESGDDVAAIAETAYRNLFTLQAELGYEYLLRTWLYLGAINAGCGEDERYKRFCQGRGRALDALEQPLRLPAATVIGGEAPGLQMRFVATRRAPTPIENPRQTSAYRYPPRYGQRRPAFVRAARMDWPNGARQLFISGTASIVGHATRHVGDTASQLDEALANVAALLREAGEPFGAAGIGDLDYLRVYLREPADVATVRTALGKHADTGLAWLCLRADLCRTNLLVEVEGQITR